MLDTYQMQIKSHTHRFEILDMKDIMQLELLKFGYGIDHKIHPQPILDLFTKMEKNY